METLAAPAIKITETGKGQSDHQVLVEARDGGEVVGTLVAHYQFFATKPTYSAWSIWNVEVSRKREGIATQMLEALHKAYPGWKILHSGFASDEGKAWAESTPRSWNRVKGWDDRSFRRPTGGLSLEAVISVAEEAMERAGLAGDTIVVPQGHADDPAHRAALEPLEAFCTKVVGQPMYRKVFTNAYTLQQAGNPQAMVTPTGSIVLRPTTTRMALLHECAHIITRTQEGEGHDDTFVRVVTDLYRKHISAEASEMFARLVGFRTAAKQIEHRDFKAFLNDGRVVNCKAIERDDDGGMWIITTMDERFPSSKIINLKAAALDGREMEGRVGDASHITRVEQGTIPTEVIANLKGVKGEVPGEHRNRQGQVWEEWAEGVARDGIENPIFITVDWMDTPKISEGNHRRDAAVYKQMPEVPVEIRYFGHAERQGTVIERFERGTLDRIPPRIAAGASAYRGFRVPLLDKSMALRLLGDLASGDRASTIKAVVQAIASGKREAWWDDSPYGDGGGTGTWWSLMANDAETYSEPGAGFGIPVVLTARFDEEAWKPYGGVNGQAHYYRLAPGTPVEITKAEAVVPSPDAAGMMLALIERGLDLGSYQAGDWNSEGDGIPVDLPVGSLPRTALRPTRVERQDKTGATIYFWRTYVDVGTPDYPEVEGWVWASYDPDDDDIEGSGVVGALRWDTLAEPPYVLDLSVGGEYQRRGIATMLFNFAKEAYPSLVHSDVLTDDGRGFRDSFGKIASSEVTRGLVMHEPSRALIDKIEQERETAQDFLRELGALGTYWDDGTQTGIQPEDWAYAEEMASEYLDEGDNTGEISVVIVADKPETYGSDDIDEGGAWIDPGTSMRLKEIRYDAGWGWKTLPARGIVVQAASDVREYPSYEALIAGEAPQPGSKTYLPIYLKPDGTVLISRTHASIVTNYRKASIDGWIRVVLRYGGEFSMEVGEVPITDAQYRFIRAALGDTPAGYVDFRDSDRRKIPSHDVESLTGLGFRKFGSKTATSDAWKNIKGLVFESGSSAPPFHDERRVTARMANGDFVGTIKWYNFGEIINIEVIPKYQRMGIATELLRRAREIDPSVHHSESLTQDGKAWSQVAGSKTAIRQGISVVNVQVGSDGRGAVGEVAGWPNPALAYRGFGSWDELKDSVRAGGWKSQGMFSTPGEGDTQVAFSLQDVLAWSSKHPMRGTGNVGIIEVNIAGLPFETHRTPSEDVSGMHTGDGLYVNEDGDGVFYPDTGLGLGIVGDIALGRIIRVYEVTNGRLGKSWPFREWESHIDRLTDNPDWTPEVKTRPRTHRFPIIWGRAGTYHRATADHDKAECGKEVMGFSAKTALVNQGELMDGGPITDEWTGRKINPGRPCRHCFDWVGQRAAAVDPFKGTDRNMSKRQVEQACTRILKDIAKEYGYTGKLPQVVIENFIGPTGRYVSDKHMILLNESDWLEDAYHKDYGYSAFRILAHEAIHAMFAEYVPGGTWGEAHDLEEAGAEVLAIAYWAKNAPPLDERDLVRRRERGTGWTDPGAETLANGINYEDLVASLIRRCATTVGWRGDAIIAEVNRLMRLDRFDRHQWWMNTREAPLPQGARSNGKDLALWLISHIRRTAKTAADHALSCSVLEEQAINEGIAGRVYKDVAEVQAYVDRVCGKGRAIVDTESQRGSRATTHHLMGATFITYPPRKGIHEMVILHECAHVLEDRLEDEANAHDGSFLRTYVRLLNENLPGAVEVFRRVVKGGALDLTFQSGGDANGDQYDGWVAAYLGGVKVGYFDWTLYEGGLHIRYIEVEPEHRRKGIAQAMVDHVIAEQTQFGDPAPKVDPGMLTPDGSKWWPKVKQRYAAKEVSLDAKKREVEAEAQRIGHDLKAWKGDTMGGARAVCKRCTHDVSINKIQPYQKGDRFMDDGSGWWVHWNPMVAEEGCDPPKIEVYRGVRIQEPEAIEKVVRALGNPQGAGKVILDYLEQRGGVGEHWSQHEDIARGYSKGRVLSLDMGNTKDFEFDPKEYAGMALPVLLKGVMHYEDQRANYRTDYVPPLPEYEHEGEVWLRKHEKVRVHGIEVWTGGRWLDLGSMTRTVKAMKSSKIGPLYHGTTVEKAEQILASGFQLRDNRQGAAVYLTENPDLAMRYAQGAVKRDGGEPAVLKVESVEGVSAMEVGYLDLDLAREAGADYSPQHGEVIVLNLGAIKGGITRVAYMMDHTEAYWIEPDGTYEEVPYHDAIDGGTQGALERGAVRVILRMGDEDNRGRTGNDPPPHAGGVIFEARTKMTEAQKKVLLGWAKEIKAREVAYDVPGASDVRWFDTPGEAQQWMGKVATLIPKPTKGMFSSGSPTLDPRLFDGDRLKSQARDLLIGALDAFWTPLYGDWRKWARLYIAGSAASHWWDSDSDLDMLIGINKAALDKARPANQDVTEDQACGALNRRLYDELNPQTKDLLGVNVTWFVNPGSWDIDSLNPYAAYDVLADTWVQRPPVLPPDWGPDYFPEAWWDEAERVADEATGLLESDDEPAIVAYYDALHEERQKAYTEWGNGWVDWGNFLYQVLAQWGIIVRLREVKDEGPAIPV